VEAFALGAAADPYPLYAELRAAGALVPAGPGTFAVGRYRDVAALLDDPRLSHRFPDSYRQFAVGPGETAELLQRIVSSQQPPAHTEVRSWLGTALGGALGPRWWGEVRALVDATVAALVDGHRFDLVADLAAPLAVDLVSALYGFTADERAEVAGARILGRAFTALKLSPDDRASADERIRRMRTLLAGALDPDRDGLLGRLADPAARHRPDPAVAVDNAVFLCFTAIEMIEAAVATCGALLVAHPDQLALVRTEPALLPGAIEELVRYDSPTQGTARLVTEPVEVAGQVLRPGRIVILLLGAANRDDREFTDPDRLDVTRPRRPHLGFGGGIYRCLGGALVTQLTGIVLRRLLSRTDDLRAAGPVRRSDPATGCRTYVSVPVAARPASTTPDREDPR
jgi:cytochrome P450